MNEVSAQRRSVAGPSSQLSAWPQLAATALAGLLAVAGCGEPLVVLGDAPGYLRVVAGIGGSPGTQVDSLATLTRLTDPAVVAFDAAAGVLYLADRGALRQYQGTTTHVARILAVNSAGRIRLLMDNGGCSGSVCLVEPTAMTLALDGTLIVADGLGQRVFRFSPANSALTVIAGTGTSAYSADGTPAAQASLRRPAGVAVAEDGSMFVAEETGNQVRRIDPAGLLQTVAGSGSASSGGDGGSATGAGIYLPAGLASGPGQLYIAESGAHRVRRVDLDHATIETVAGTGARSFGGDGGPAIQASLAVPQSLALTPGGNALYISDRDNHRVRLLNLNTGIITTYAGNGSTIFSGTRQPAGVTALRSPRGLSATGGFLFIADPAMYVVWRAAITR